MLKSFFRLNLVLSVIIVLFSLKISFGQSCGVCLAKNKLDYTCKLPSNETFKGKNPITRNQSKNSTWVKEITISFSHHQALEDYLGIDSLVAIHKKIIDSLNVALERSNINILAKKSFEPLVVVGPPVDTFKNILGRITSGTPPYDIINQQKKCSESHFNVHMVTDYFTDGVGGVAILPSSQGHYVTSANALVYFNKRDYHLTQLVRTTLHEIGHLLGGGHEDGYGSGTYDFSHAYIDSMIFKATIMWHESVAPQFAVMAYSKDTVVNGLRLGDVNHDNSKTANILKDFAYDFFEIHYSVTTSADSVCIGDSLSITINTDKGDEFMWEGDHIIGTGQSVIFSSDVPGIFQVIGSTINSSAGSCVWKSDTVNILVYDCAIPPTAICKNTTAFLDRNGVITVSPEEIDNGSFDTDGTLSSLLIDNNSHVSFDCSDLGTQLLTLSVWDNDGLSSSCNAIITVVDTLIPQLQCKGDTTFQLQMMDTIILVSSDLVESFSDNCAASLSISQNTFYGSTPGDYLVELIATDDSGNHNNCSLIVSIEAVLTNTINVNDAQNIEIFPNPTNSYINVRLPLALKHHKYSVDVINLMGDILYHHDFSGNEEITKMDVSQLESAVYLLRVKTGGNVFSKRFLVK